MELKQAFTRLDGEFRWLPVLAFGAEGVEFSRKSLRWLKKQALCGNNSQFRVAALLTLKDRGTGELLGLARQAQESNDERVQAAGKDIVQALNVQGVAHET